MSRKSTPSRPTPPRTPNAGSHRHSMGSAPAKKPLPVFNSYMSLFQVQEKLKKGEVIEGVLRINPKSYEDAYISAPDGGMDIFIGGVRDRNTALHGDVVAALFNPHDQWKVVYSQLDAFLEEHEDLRALVHKPIESNISYTDNASSSTLSDVHNTNVKSHITNKTSDRISETNCDVVVEEEKEEESSSAEHQSKKKKKHRRGKKRKGRKEVIEVLKDSFALCQESNMVDSVEVISCPSKVEIDLPREDDSSLNPSDVVIVPPDQLSECDLSDGSDASVNSLTLGFQSSLGLGKKICITNDNIINSGIKSDLQGSKGMVSNPALEELPPVPYNQNKDEGINKRSTKKQRVKANKSKEFPEIIKLNTCPDKDHKKFLSVSKENNFSSAAKPILKTSSKMENINQDSKPSVEQIMRLPEWEKFVQKTATVVHILERKHTMLAVGILKPFADNNPHMALFSPFDCRIPRMKIQTSKCPHSFLARPSDYSKVILLAKITEWNDPKFAYGELCRDIGRVGDVEAETESLLVENGIDFDEFPESVLKDLPHLPWTIPEEELKKRTDLRSSIIFTIDPATARDLDDAVSCLPLPNGNFRVGVHIADASYFVPADTELDKIAEKRANSVYLVQKVIPMLPRPLCEELCSLNPGEDKLSFSVIWELTPDGIILGEWFGRTVIRSCVKLSYDHAQSMIENPNQVFNPEEFPALSGGVSLRKISSIINNLYKISLRLREKRVENGALRLNQVKIGFSLDSESKTPNGIFTQVMRESNRLIEEFMLLANISVARKISAAFPNLALLRKHPPPHDVQIENTLKFLTQHNIQLDATTSKSLNESIQQYSGSDPFSLARMQLIVNVCSKPMQYARYFCAGLVPLKDQHHYALSVPCYTHYTSPIRRYADIIVHRMLAAALDSQQNPLPHWNNKKIEKMADHCNDKKQASKVVQEGSNDIYLSVFVRNVGEIVEDGMIIGVLDKSVDVLLLRLGIIKRCYMEKLPLNKFFLVQEDNRNVILIEWKEDPSSQLPSFTQRLSYFDSVTVILRPFENDALKTNAFLVRPGK